MQETPFRRHEPLYLKYRPQLLKELVGQEGVQRTLVNAIQNNRLSHAYLFTGPRGTGKTSSARILAKSINCKTAGGPTTEPCQSCSCCMEITKGSSPGVFEIDAASNNSVDDARILIERAPLVAVGTEFKVYIIDECHMLSKEAFNALLKTIEQPPPRVVFILATTEEHKVLPTIVSRCQRLMFKLISQDELTRHLRWVADRESIAIEDEALHLIARRSGGGLRDALSNLDQAALLAAPGSPATVADLLALLGALHEDVLLDLSRQIAERDGKAVVDSVNQFLDQGREPHIVIQEMSRHFLNLIKASYLSTNRQPDLSSLKAAVAGSDSYLNGLFSQTSLYEKAELSQIIEHLGKLEGACRQSSQPSMHLEIGLLGICHRQDIHLVKDLLARIQRLEEQANIPGMREIRTSVSEVASASHVSSGSSQADFTQVNRSRQTTERSFGQSRPGPAETAGRHEDSAADDRSTAQMIAPAMDHKPAVSSSADANSGTAGTNAGEIKKTPAPAAKKEEHPPAEEGGAARSESPARSESDDPEISALNADIEFFWQQVLDELQRRHLPTFSLASTHAFPVRIGKGEVTIGVIKDSFQKMLESKSEHIRVACKAVTGIDLAVRIRVSESAGAPAKNPRPAATNRPAQSSRDERERSEKGSSQEREDGNSPPGEGHDSPPPAASRPARSTDSGEEGLDSTLVKEAYKLFEGPGSRRIN